MTVKEQHPYLLTVPEAAHLLGLKKSKVYQMVKEHCLPNVKLGRYVRIPRHALEKWIETRMTATF